MKRRLIGLLVALILLVSPSALAATTLRLGTIMPANSVVGLGAEKFAALVEEKSGGELKIQVFHNSQLGPTMTQVEGVMMGTQDLFIDGMELFERWAPELRILSVFYAFRDVEHLDRFLHSDIFEEIQDKLRRAGVEFINKEFNWLRGPYRVLVSTKPVFTLDDLKGLRLRMPEVETLQRSWRHLGATTTTIAWSEVYLALKQGVIDGLTSPLDLIYANKFTEVAKYIIEVRTFPQRLAVAMNARTYSRLPERYQQILREAADEAGKWYSQLVLANAEADIKAMLEEHGAYYIRIPLGPWRERMESLTREMEQSGYLPKGLYDRIHQL